MSNNANEMISGVENEFLSIEKGEEWTSFFYAIRNECAQTHSFSSAEAKKSENKDLNRYRDVNPYDHSRVILSKGSSDYINANLVIVEKAKRKYILTQGPLPQTTSHFWLMIWDQNCKAIVMLNRIIEKNMIKCHQYWPSEESSGEDKSFVFSDVNLKVTNVSEERNTNYTTTTLRLEELATGSVREVIHYHYTTWPDFGVPQSPTAFLKFLEVVRSSGALEADVGPAVVHCSAGIGRSGTFCLVDSCIVMIRDMKLKDVVVKDVLMEMRKYRMGLIQTPSQLRFSYLAIIKGIKKADNANGLVDEETDEVKESESEEEAPPLPPPRNESLARTHANNEATKENADDATAAHNNLEPNRKRLHTKPSRGGRSSTTRRRHPYKREDRYLHRKHRDRALLIPAANELLNNSSSAALFGPDTVEMDLGDSGRPRKQKGNARKLDGMRKVPRRRCKQLGRSGRRRGKIENKMAQHRAKKRKRLLKGLRSKKGGNCIEESSEVRQRKAEREQRQELLENKVKEMKRKLQEAESWRKWKKSLLHPWSIGCFIVGGGIIVYALLAARG